jgi:ParB-like chromosome segregation protein Spo0J
MKVPISSIRVDKSDSLSKRARADFGDIELLADSIKEHGLMHPVVVDKLHDPVDDKEYVLIAGERRLRAVALLGHQEIAVTLFSNTNEMQRKSMELTENIARKDLSWPEEVECLKQLHELKQLLYGDAGATKDGKGWGVRQTAQALGRSVGSVGMDLKLASDLDEHPELVKKVKDLPKVAARRVVMHQLEANRLRELVDKKQIELGVELQHGNCVDLARSLPNESIDCLITDPPFAIEQIIAGGVTNTAAFNVIESNVSTPEIMEATYAELFPILAKKLKPGAHCYVFFGMGPMYDFLMTIMSKHGFLTDNLPIIWYKTRQSAQVREYHYMTTYEAILFSHFQERSRCLKNHTHNVLTIPMLAAQKKVHPLQRPDELLRILIENSTHPGELILDCFAGSGSTLKVARDLQRKAIGFELDEGNYLKAVNWLGETK